MTSAIDDLAEPDDTGASAAHVRGSTLLLVGRLLSVGVNLVSQVLIARHLSQTDFGAFALAFAVASVGQVFITLGLHRGATQFFARFEEARDYPRLVGTILLNIGVIVGLGALLVVGVALAQGWLTAGGVLDPTATGILLILILLAPIDALDDMLIALYAVFGVSRAIFVRRYLLGPGLRLAVAAVLVLADGDATQLAIGYLLATIFGIVVYGALFVRLLERRGVLRAVRTDPPTAPAREILHFSVPLLTNDGVWLLVNTLPLVVLTATSGLDQVAAFQVIRPAAALNMLVANSFYVLYLPVASRLATRPDHAASSDLYWRTAIWVAVISFPIFAVTFALGRPVAELLFGERYGSSGTYLSILAIAYYANATFGFNTVTLAAHGHGRIVALINAVSAIVGIVAALVFIPPLGALGAAISVSATLLLQTMLLQVAQARKVRIAAIDREAARVFVIVLVAAGFLFAVDATGILGWWTIGLAAVVSVVVLFLGRDALRVDTLFPELRPIFERIDARRPRWTRR